MKRNFRMKNAFKSLFVIIAAVAATGLFQLNCSNPATSSSLTGTVSIDGEAWVGETLFANTADLNGDGKIYYHWRRGGTTIEGESSDAYTVQDADIGHRITLSIVRLNNAGSVTSNPTISVIFPPLGESVRIDGISYVDSTLRADTSEVRGDGQIVYEWRRSGSTAIIGNNDTYTIGTADTGSAITLTVTRARNSGSLVSEPTAPVTLTTIPPGIVRIDGTAWVDSTLRADVSEVFGSGDIIYEWRRDGNRIPNAFNNIYIVQDADVGSVITVAVRRTRNFGYITSEPTDYAIFTPITGSVEITGVPPAVGQRLTVDVSGLGGSGTISYEWRRSESDDVIGRDSTYLVHANDINRTITVTVTRARNSGSVESEPTSPVPLGGALRITGDVLVGGTLRADIGSLGGSGAISYQWRRRGSTNVIGREATYNVLFTDTDFSFTVTVEREGVDGSVTSDPTVSVPWPSVWASGNPLLANTLTAFTSNIVMSDRMSFVWRHAGSSDAIGTNPSYTIRSSDLLRTLVVSVTDGRGSFSSNPIGPVPQPLTIEGSALVGGVLTINTANLGGSGPITARQWFRGNSEEISGANGATYTVQFGDTGKVISVFANRADLGSGITSPTTNPVPAPVVNIAGGDSPRVGETLTATLSNVAIGLGTAVSYHWRRAGVHIGSSTIGTNYTVQFADVNAALVVVATISGLSDSSSSTLTGIIPVPVSIVGAANVGQQLTADVSNLGGTGAISYQWRRGGNTNVGTSNTYFVQSGDAGSTITVTVSRTGITGSYTSDPVTIAGP
jgi:hypothetical protein